MSEANTKNRKKGPKASHTGGSININTHARKIAEKTGRSSIPHAEAYKAMHIKRLKKGESQHNLEAPPEWIHEHAHEPYDRWIEICTREFGDDPTTWPDWDPKIWTEASGPPVKGKQKGIAYDINPETVGIPWRKRGPYFEEQLERQQLETLKASGKYRANNC